MKEKGKTERNMVYTSIVLTALVALIILGAGLLMPESAEANFNNYGGNPCTDCHTADLNTTPNPNQAVFFAIDGVITTTVNVNDGDTFEIDTYARNIMGEESNYESLGFLLNLPNATWVVSSGTTSSAPAGWTSWDANWDVASSDNDSTIGWQQSFTLTTYYTIEMEKNGNYSNSGTHCNDGSLGTGGQDKCADLDNSLLHGTDVSIQVPPGYATGSYTVEFMYIGHYGGTRARYLQNITVNVTNTGGGNTTTVGDGGLPGNKYAGPSDANVGVSTFTLSTDTGTDTVTAIDVTGNTGSAANLTSVSIYDDSTGTTPNEWDASDTFVATNTGFTSDVANFTGLSINVTTSSVQYVITDTIDGAPTNGQTLTGYVSSITAGNTIVNNDNADATITIDALAPAYAWNTPAAGTYYKDTDAISVDADITEAGAGITNGAGCTPLIDGASASFSGTVTYATGTGKCTGTLTLGNPSALSDGAHNLTLEVADDVGNTQQSAARSINIDNTPPVTTDDVPAGWQASDVTVTLGITETGSGVLQMLYCVDTGDTCSPGITYSVPFSVTCPTDTACTQYVRYYSEDNAGNQETPVNSTLSQIDKAAPAAAALSDGGKTANSVTLLWSNPADSGSGNASYDIRYVTGPTFDEATQWAGANDPGGEQAPPTTGLTVGSLSPGTEYTFGLKTTDNVGNQSILSTLTVTTTVTTTTTVGDGGLPSDKYAGPSDTDVGVSTFTLSTSTGTDTVTGIVVTGINTANIAGSGVEIFDDSTGTILNEWDASDTSIASASFSGATATFTGLNINVTTSSVQYLITYDMTAAPTDAETLTGYVSSITAGNPVTYNDNVDATITIDALASVTTDDVPAGWQASDATVTLGITETGSGILQTLYCVDTGDTCSPGITYSVPFSVTCPADTACTQYVRYYSEDNVGNQETVNSTVSQIDKAAPLAVSDFASPDKTEITLDLTWSNPADSGSGNVSYDVRYVTGATFNEAQWAGATDPAGEQTPPTTGLTVGSLSPGTTYAFAVKTTDNVGNQSIISNIVTTATKSPPDDPGSLQQYNTSLVPITPAGSTAETTVIIEASVNDPDGDRVMLEVDIDSDADVDCISGYVTGSGTVQANCRGLKDSPYDWQVRAKDEDGGISGWVVMSGTPDFTVTAGMDVGIDTTAPVDGTLSATPNDQVLDLSWTEADDGLTGIGLDPVNTYKLVRATEPSVPADYCTEAGIYIGNGNAYLDTGLSNGTQYNYRVCAYDKLGNGSIGTTVSATPSSAPTTTIGNGTDPADNTEAEPGTLQYIDEFTLVTNTGTDQVIEVQVTTPANTVQIADVGVYNNLDALIASQNTPAGNVWVIDLSGSPLNINATPLDYRIEITLKDHTTMAVGSWPITATVTSFTSGNLTAGVDSSSATITADNDPPADASWGTNIPGAQQVILNWSNPVDTDFAGVIVLRETSSITDAPTDGQIYSTGLFPAGTSEIIYVGALQTFTDTSLTNGQIYYYRIFSRDNSRNYAAGVETSEIPTAVTTVGNGTDPSSVPAAEPGTVNYVDQFTLYTSSGIDTVTGLTVTTANTAEIAGVEIKDNTNTISYGTQSTPAGDDWSITLSPQIGINTSPVPLRVYVMLKDHASMTIGTWAITATVTLITTGNVAISYEDAGSATITADNAPPAGATWGTNSPGDQHIVLNWNNPGDSDFAEVLILRETSSITDAPTDGQTYSTGPFPAGTSEIIYVGSLETFDDTGLTNAQVYYYKIFSRDNAKNYASGVETNETPVPPTTYIGDGTDPGDSTVEPGTTLILDKFTLYTSAGSSDTVTDLIFTTPNYTSEIISIEVWDDSGATTNYGTQSTPTGNNWAVTLSPQISANDTPVQFAVKINMVDHATMLAGTSLAYTGTVTSITVTTNPTGGTDTDSAVISADNEAPVNAAWDTISEENNQNVLNWYNPGEPDFAEVVILKNTAAIADAPTDGSTYSAPGTINTSDIVYVGNLATYTDTDAVNYNDYYYKVFARDTYNNFATGVETGPHTPTPISTTVGDGANPTDLPLAPGDGAAMLNAFTLQATTGTDTVTALTVTLAAGTSGGISLVEITDDDGSVVEGSASNPASDTVNIGSLNIGVDTNITQYKVRITTKTHANMPSPASGTAYTVTGTVTSITATNTPAYNDSASGTITIDNQSPSNATWGTITPGDAQIVLNWTNPADADFDQVVILRSTLTILDTPVEGATYSKYDTVGVSTVWYVGDLQTFTDTGLTNGQNYYYKAFASDASGNFATGLETGPHAATGACVRTDPTVTITPDQDVFPGGIATYTMYITNNDTDACLDTTFNISIQTETGDTGSFNATSAPSPSNIVISAGDTSSSAVTVAGNGTGTDAQFMVTSVRTGSSNHNNVDKNITTTITTSAWIHNSDNLSTKGWPSGWGITGGQYGEFVCETCHTDSTNNIKRVKETITVPNGTDNLPNGSTTAAVVFTNAQDGSSNFGDDNDPSGHTNSNKICEVCHQNTNFHRWDTTGQSDLTHNNQRDCTECHSHNAAFTGAGSAECKSCHNVAKTGGYYNPRQIVGAGGDFVKLSRHVNDGTTNEIITSYACVVCHAEGDADAVAAGTGWQDQGNTHNDGSTSTTRMVNLRDVDNYSGASFEFNKNVLNAGVDETMRGDLDQFCLNCHDFDGASTINVNNAGDGLNLDSTNALNPFGTFYTSITRDGKTRSRVVDVKSQFYEGTNGPGATYNGNPSQHAVIGPRYSTFEPAWPATAWTNHVLKNGLAINSNSAREATTLHCSDCHLSEVNAHGADDAWHLLQNGTPGSGNYTTAPYRTDEIMTGFSPETKAASVVCYKCHSSSVYSASPAAGSRFTHSGEGRAFDDNVLMGTGARRAILGVGCLTCHSGGGYGHIHGRGSATDLDNGTYTNPAGSFTKYRFMPGAYMEWGPTDSSTGTDTDWETTNANATCYFQNDSNWSLCAQHGNAVAKGSASNYNRPVRY